MLKRRVPRLMLTGFLMIVATSGLSACRTAPNVAAYVGDERVTVSELDAAVAERLEDEDVAAFADAQGDEFTRQVLAGLVSREVFDAAAERYDVEVADAAVRDQLDQLLAGQDTDEAYAAAAQQGYTRDDVFQNIRERLLQQEIAEAAGQGGALTEEALRTRYEDSQDSLTGVSMGLITVPDQATADAVLAQLNASPAVYPQLAAQFAGDYTLPGLQVLVPEDLPEVFRPGLAAAEPNTGFTTPVPEAGGVVVAFVEGPPTFEQVRAELEQQATAELDQAGADLVADVREDIGVRINPRFQPTDEDSGVVDILGGEETPAG